MSKIYANQEISTIIFNNNAIIYGTYHLENNIKSGLISRDNQEIAITSGTFEVKMLDNTIFAANCTDIIKIAERVESYPTEFINTSIDISGNLYVSQSNGKVTILSSSFMYVKETLICKDHIIWITRVFDEYLFSGCDCGRFTIYDLRGDKIILEEKRSSGITSIHKNNNLYLVGGYDGKIMMYNENFVKVRTLDFFNVWRIVNARHHLAVACMYDGVKIVDLDFGIVKEYKTESIAYGIDYKNGILIFSDFYEKCYYSITL